MRIRHETTFVEIYQNSGNHFRVKPFIIRDFHCIVADVFKKSVVLAFKQPYMVKSKDRGSIDAHSAPKQFRFCEVLKALITSGYVSRLLLLQSFVGKTSYFSNYGLCKVVGSFVLFLICSHYFLTAG